MASNRKHSTIGWRILMENLLQIALNAAIEAGKKILEVYRDDFSVTFKNDKSPLTLADQISHQTIASYLTDTGFPILSEEGADIDYTQRKTWKKFWCVDPLDGTKEFIQRNGEFTVNIALIENNYPLLGVVYVPVKDCMYWGGKEFGSFKLTDASKRIQENKMEAKKTLPETNANRLFTVVASRSHMNEPTRLFIENLKKQKGDLEIISAGSSLKICMVAEGVADVYPRFGPTMEWDVAAGQAIAEGAKSEVIQWPELTRLSYNKESLKNGPFIVRSLSVDLTSLS